MTMSPARPLPPAAAVEKPEPIRAKPSPKPAEARSRAETKPPKPDAKILFQTYFKSVGPRTYAAQLKKAGQRQPLPRLHRRQARRQDPGSPQGEPLPFQRGL